ncbi:putative PilT protein (plasmid) [Fischerella sp. NIES-4106]|jgi:ribonuclease VapC|nr:putative PilT protein [Fischerella sp. NIES-4106]
MTVVLDASALLAYLKDEPGGDAVDRVLAESVMSSVNWAEVVQKSIAAGVEVDGMLDDLQSLGLMVEPFTPDDGEITGQLWAQTRQVGLSLGDRACLSLGLRLEVPVLTSDRAWATLNLSLDVQVIR